MSIRSMLTRALVALLLSAPGVGLAANALIVHDGTAGLEANVLGNLTGKLAAATYTVTPSVGVPGGSLATYKQIWDIRFNNTTPLTGSDISAYVTFMAGGGSLFVMGENTGFPTRNNSIISLVSTAGGGAITAVNPVSQAQTVQSPFTGPNAVATVTFLAAAASPTTGTGAYVTKDGSNFGASLVWSPGTLSGAAAGALILVFDVNFLDPSADAASQAFSNNLIAYLAAPSPLGSSPVPALSTWALIALGLALAAAAVKILFVRAA